MGLYPGQPMLHADELQADLGYSLYSTNQRFCLRRPRLDRALERFGVAKQRGQRHDEDIPH